MTSDFVSGFIRGAAFVGEGMHRILTCPSRSPEARIVSTILYLKNLKGTF